MIRDNNSYKVFFGKKGMFDQEAFNEFVINQGVIQFDYKGVKLPSGRISKWDVKWGHILQNIKSCEKVARQIIDFVVDKELKPDCFYGVPDRATSIGFLTQYLWEKEFPLPKGSRNFVMARGKTKTRGTALEGSFEGAPYGRTLIIDDTVDTGKSILEAVARRYLAPEAQVVGVLVLTDRNARSPIPETDNARVVELYKECFDRAARKPNANLVRYEPGDPTTTVFNAAGIKLYAMSEAKNILPKAYQVAKLDGDFGTLIEAEFEKYGAAPVKLSSE